MVVNLISVLVFHNLVRNNHQIQSGVAPDNSIKGTCLPWGVVLTAIYIHQANGYALHPLSNSSGLAVSSKQTTDTSFDLQLAFYILIQNLFGTEIWFKIKILLQTLRCFMCKLFTVTAIIFKRIFVCLV